MTEDEDEVMIQLMQKTSRTKTGDDNETIGCTLIKVSNQIYFDTLVFFLIHLSNVDIMGRI